MLVVEVGAGHVDEFGGLILDGFDDFGMTVAGGVDGDAGGEVEELVAVDVGDADAAAGFGHHGIAAGVAGGDEAVIVGDDLLGERTGEGGLQSWGRTGCRRLRWRCGSALGFPGRVLMRVSLRCRLSAVRGCRSVASGCPEVGLRPLTLIAEGNGVRWRLDFAGWWSCA